MSRATPEPGRLQSAQVISLSDSDRIHQFFSQPEAQRFTRFRAFDGRNCPWDDHVDREVFRARYGGDPTNGQAGCAISHTQIICGFAEESGMPHDLLLVAEDDVVFEPAFEDVLEKVSAQGDFDIAVLADAWSLDPRRHLHRRLMATSQPSLLASRIRSTGQWYRFGRFSGAAYTAALYLVTRSGALKFATHVKGVEGKVGWLADDWAVLRDEMGLDVKILRPSLAWWSGGSTTRSPEVVSKEAREEALKQNERLRIRNRLFTALALRSRGKGAVLSLRATALDLNVRFSGNRPY